MERRAAAESSRGPSAHQPNAFPLGHTSFTLTKPATFPLKMNNPANPHPSSWTLRRMYNTSSPLPMGSPFNLTKSATLAPAQNPAVNTHHPSSTLRRMLGSTHQVLFLWIQPFTLTKSVTLPPFNMTQQSIPIILVINSICVKDLMRCYLYIFPVLSFMTFYIHRNHY